MMVGIFLIRIGIALVYFVFGLHQFFYHELWFRYLPDEFGSLITSRSFFVFSVSSVNIFLSILLVSGFFPLFSAWCAFVWQVCSLPFHFYTNWKFGMQEVGLSVCVFALIFLLS